MYPIQILPISSKTSFSFFKINIKNLYPVYIGNFVICDGASATLDAGNPGSEYVWSTGDTVQSITVATGGSYIQANTPDATVTQMLFDNGVRGHIFVSWLHPHKEQRLVVVGSRKMAVFDDVAKHLLIYDQRVEWQDGRVSDACGIAIELDHSERIAIYVDVVFEYARRRGNEKCGVLVRDVAVPRGLLCGDTTA